MKKRKKIHLFITLEPTETGVLGYIYARQPAKSARTVEVEPASIMADYDVQGALQGVEFLHAEQMNAARMQALARKLACPELAGIDLAEMCKTAV